MTNTVRDFKRLQPEERRRQLLEIGAELALTPSGHLLDRVSVADVAQAAGVTDATVYHHFENKQAFEEALLEHLLTERRFEATEEALAAAEDLLLAETELAEMIDRLTLAMAPPPEVQSAQRFLMSLWGRNDPRSDELVREKWQAIDERRQEMLETIFTAYGLEPRSPFTWELITATISGLLVGLVARRSVTRPQQVAAERKAEGPTVVGLILLSFLRTALRPIAEKGPQDVWDLLRGEESLTGRPMLPLARTSIEREHVRERWRTGS